MTRPCEAYTEILLRRVNRGLIFLKFSRSLKENHEFRRLYKKGETAVSPFMVVYVRKRKGDYNRLGITVSAKLGHAVVRNRIRRRIREIYRINEGSFSPGFDIVVVARSRAVTAPFALLSADFLNLMGKLGVMR